MFYTNQLHKLSADEFDMNNKSNLIDIKNLSIDIAQSKSDLIIQDFNAVRNPYLFRVGDTAVQIRYRKRNQTLQESVTNFLISK